MYLYMLHKNKFNKSILELKFLNGKILHKTRLIDRDTMTSHKWACCCQLTYKGKNML